MKESGNKNSETDFLINLKEEKIRYKMCNKFNLFFISLTVLFLILTGYFIYDYYKDVQDTKKEQRDLEDRLRIREILKEISEKLQKFTQPISSSDFSEYENPMNLNSQDWSPNIYSNRFKRDSTKLKVNKKRELDRSLWQCQNNRERCDNLMNTMRKNLKAAEMALVNINNIIQQLSIITPETMQLLICLQCDQWEHSNMINQNSDSNYPNSIPNYQNSDRNHPNSIPKYQNSDSNYPNSIPKYQNYYRQDPYNNHNPYAVQKVYNPNNYNMYPNNMQPNFYNPNPYNNPIPYDPNYIPNYKVQNPGNQNPYNSNYNNPQANFNGNLNPKDNNDSIQNDNSFENDISNKNSLSREDIQTIVLSSKKNTSRIKDGEKITEVIRNKTIVEKNLSTERPVAISTVKDEPTRFTLPIEALRSEKLSADVDLNSKTTTRHTKNSEVFKQNFNEATEDPLILKPTAESAKAAIAGHSDDKIESRMCWYPVICFIKKESGLQVQAPLSSASGSDVSAFESAPSTYDWNPSQPSGSNFNSFAPTGYFGPYQWGFGPTGPEGTFGYRNSANKPVECSRVSPNLQGIFGLRAGGSPNDTKTHLKNPGIQECPENYTKCSDASKCILRRNWCDGIVDCLDSSDETQCNCKDRITLSKHCDGYFDCPRGEDELGCFGCGNNSFSCMDWSKRDFQGSCVSLSQRCDGERQCRNGRDEQDCHLLTESYIDSDAISTIGHSSGYLFKNWHGKWYPACSSTENWADEACRGEIGSLTGSPTIKMEPVLNYSRLSPYISMTDSGNIELVPECDNQAVFVKCPSIPCGSVLADQYNEFLPYEDILVASPHLSDSNSTDSVTSETTLPAEEVSEDLSNLARISTDNRIVGGRTSQPQAWPFLVAIYRDGFFHCGGSIVDERWILTAAHCVENYDSHYYQIFAGLLRRFSFAPMAQIRQAQAVIPHPDFSGRIMRNDLALIRLNEPLRLNRWIRATCIPIPVWGKIPHDNETCTTVGWGATAENGPDPDYLREVEVPVVKCIDKNDRGNGIVCAGEKEGGKDACQGDSGGPLLCKIPNSQRWYVAGIVSYGEGCARPNKTGVYTRVSYYYPWINETMKNDYEPFGPKPLSVCPGFKCDGEMGKCLPLKRRCDKKVDCLDGEDEAHCYRFYNHIKETTTASVKTTDEPTSTSGEVIEEVAVKNHKNPEAAEKPIKNETHKNPNEIFLDYYDYVDVNETDLEGIIHAQTGLYDEVTEEIEETTESSTSLYDQYNDIDARAHEEKEMSTIVLPTEFWIMPDNLDYTCEKINQNVDRSFRCDKKIDCQDGTDELNCRCTDILYIKHPLAICDGRIDCADGTDELNCDDGRNLTETYLCTRSATLIPAEKRCDKKNDCPLLDDERDCFALTNGHQLELDIEGSTVFKKNGILSRNEANFWSFMCFNNETNIEDIADSYCELLGFHNHESASFHYVDQKVLEIIPTSRNNSITFDREEIIRNISVKDPNVVNCQVLYLECRLNFKRPIFEYLYRSNITDNETYLLPWEPTIFVDGKYHCPALLLNTEWAMTSTRCTNDINLDKNITAVIAGVSVPYKYVDGPHQHTRIVNHIEKLDNYNTALLHFDKLPLTRYIKPIFINNRPLPPQQEERCQATGVDNKLETKSTGFDTVIKDCPSCKRCFRNSLKNRCPKNGTVEKWSGFVSCHNSRGWYPAAVFHDKNILCDFEDSQELIGIDELYPHLATIMNKNYLKPPTKCNSDGMMCTEGKCVTFEKLCDGVQDCRDGSDENEDNCFRKQVHCNSLNSSLADSLCGCNVHYLTCGNGRCISKDLFCDGSDDCGDGTDEPLGCSCRDYLRLTAPDRLCNKIRDCYDKSDESQEICKCSDGFDCFNSTKDEEKFCVPYEFVCDGQNDCPQGEDELQCRMIQSADGVSASGRVLKRQYGIWFDDCFPLPIISDDQATKICQTMKYSSGVILDEKSRSSFGPPLTIKEAQYYSLNLNGRALIILKDDVPSATLVSQTEDCNRAFIRCFP